ncbi:MAG TPA: M14 family metallopeptidase [Thermoanaerobaculia bacterium]|nr:M14 family metallopeptidase [Thermoanaerobaculia bacterium]
MITTVAETSNYLSTSRYDDVMAFLSAIQQLDPDIRVETFGTTNEGRALPLVIAGPPGVVNPFSAHTTGLPIVFVMANIHAGEVEGKEAAQMFLRDLVTTHRKLRDEVIFFIAPIYNADGNERMAADHRPTQLGPLNGYGTRENAQGLDLNRDAMKLDSPEAQGLVANVFARWDPLVFVDLHTTNGSYHGYHLTYSPSLNPNVDDDITDFARGTLLPEIRERMQKKHGKETYYYGNFVDQLTPEKGWSTFDHRPRFGTNYGSLRNRFTILSEAYSYIDFKARVEVTYQFVHEIANAVARSGSKMWRIATKADERIRRGKVRKQGVRFELAKFKDAEVLWERCVPAEPGSGAPDPETGKGMITRMGEIVPVKMTDFGIFKVTERADVPFAYLIDPNASKAIENLQLHGVIVERLNRETKIDVERFAVSEVQQADEEFQQHRELTLSGKWKSGDETFEAGTFVVRMNQPLARLAFYLIDPRSDDGLFNWNFFEVEKIAPVRRVMKPVGLDATVLARVSS